MGSGHFRVVFCGEVIEGFSVEQVCKNIAEYYRKDPGVVAGYFSGESFVLRRGLAQADAARLSRQLQELGALVYLREEESPPPAAPPRPRPEATHIARPQAPREAPAAGVSRAHRFRYGFDTYMAKGGTSVFKALVLVSVSALVLIGLARGVFQWLAPVATLQYEDLDFWGNLYVTFLQLTDPGNMAQDILSSPHYKAFSVVAGLSGVILLSALIAFITTSLDQKINELKRGRSKVIESGHTLILGWNEQRIIEILRELILANESENDACVVILADRDKEEMDDILRLRIPDTRTTRIVTRSGGVSTIANLDMVSIGTCKSAIILALCDDNSSAAEKATSDATVIQTILAVSGKTRQDDECPIVAEVYNPAHREIVEASFGEQVVTVNTSEILAKLLVQTSRSVGLSVVYNEILSFDGCEMYFYHADWGEVSFDELSYRFPDGVPMGLRHADGTLALNPPGETHVRPDDEILIVAGDDSTIEYRAQPVARSSEIPLTGDRLEKRLERELVLGWNQKAPIILREFADYVKLGSEAHVMLQDPSQAERAAIKVLNDELEALDVRVLEADCMNREGLLAARPFDYDNIIILAGAGDAAADVQQIDSRNIVTLLLLRNIFQQFPDESSNTKLITEVLDSQNHPLVARAGVKDIIISNRLVSMIIAQVSEDRSIKQVYDDIFQEDGSEIYLKPTTLYFERFPVNATFADLMGIARKRNEVCIGVKRAALEDDDQHNNGVQLIPEKNSRFSLAENDCLIVLAEDEL